MKAATTQEMRSVDGGYAVQCTFCGKVAKGLLPIGVSIFKNKHRHYGRGNGGGNTIWYGWNGSKLWA